jgi:hypothetical protein
LPDRPRFCPAYGDAPELFDLAEEILHQMAPLVFLAIMLVNLCRPFALRDNRLDPVRRQTRTQAFGIKRLVAKEGLTRDAVHKLVDRFDVMTLARQQNKAHQVSQSINQRRDLARQTAARAPDRLIESPPLAPDPC